MVIFESTKCWLKNSYKQIIHTNVGVSNDIFRSAAKPLTFVAFGWFLFTWGMALHSSESSRAFDMVKWRYVWWFSSKYFCNFESNFNCHTEDIWELTSFLDLQSRLKTVYRLLGNEKKTWNFEKTKKETKLFFQLISHL